MEYGRREAEAYYGNASHRCKGLINREISSLVIHLYSHSSVAVLVICWWSFFYFSVTSLLWIAFSFPLWYFSLSWMFCVQASASLAVGVSNVSNDVLEICIWHLDVVVTGNIAHHVKKSVFKCFLVVSGGADSEIRTSLLHLTDICSIFCCLS